MTKSLPSEADGRIIVGKVGAPHGVKGEVKIIPLTDFPDRFRTMKKITVGEEIFTVEGQRIATNGNPIMKFGGVDNRDAAARLTGKIITVSRDETMPLADDEYYAFDIVGLTVYDDNGDEIGMVDAVLKTGSNDVYTVKKSDGVEIFIPALKKVVREIDIKNKRMVITRAEEYADAN